MTPTVSTRATFDDLMRTEGKAELINGRIVRYMATGILPNRVSLSTRQQLCTKCRCLSVTSWPSLTRSRFSYIFNTPIRDLIVSFIRANSPASSFLTQLVIDCA